MVNKVTCYAWGTTGEWEAICVDLDLVAQGESLEDVRQQIDDAIDTFISYVAELPPSERAMLLKRKTPLALRLQLRFFYGLSRLLSLRRVGFASRQVFHPEVALTLTT